MHYLINHGNHEIEALDRHVKLYHKNAVPMWDRQMYLKSQSQMEGLELQPHDYTCSIYTINHNLYHHPHSHR